MMTATPFGEPGDAGREPGPVRSVDFDRPSAARRYAYWMGGKDHFGPDRKSGDRIAEVFPDIAVAVEENRRFLRRAVSFLAEAGVRQFLDIGCGMPSPPNVHEIAQDADPSSRVVYVDHDPVVLAHARALMADWLSGLVHVIDADLRNPHAILADAGVRVLDFDQPVALLLVAVLHFVDDADDPYGILARLIEALPTGSYVAVSHATFDPLPRDVATHLGRQDGHGPFHARTRSEVEGFFAGLDLVDPGLVSTVEWQPHRLPHPQASPQQAIAYAGVGRVR